MLRNQVRLAQQTESLTMPPELANGPSSLAAQVCNVGLPGQLLIEYYPPPPPGILSRRCDSKFVSMAEHLRLCVICAMGLYEERC